MALVPANTAPASAGGNLSSGSVPVSLTNPPLYSPQTAQSINAAIAHDQPGSPLKNSGATFVAAGKQYGVDPYFLAAISFAETGFGTYGPSQPIHNPFGLGPNLSFPNYQSAIYYEAKNLASPTYSSANSIGAIGAIWAPSGASNDPSGLNNNWAKNVVAGYKILTGSAPATSYTVKGTGVGLPIIAGDGTGPIGSAIGAAGSAVAGAGGDVVSGIESALGVATAWAGVGVKILEWISNPVRILETFAGLSLMVFGLLMLFRYGTSTGQTVGKAASSAVVRAGVAGAMA